MEVLYSQEALQISVLLVQGSVSDACYLYPPILSLLSNQRQLMALFSKLQVLFPCQSDPGMGPVHSSPLVP